MGDENGVVRFASSNPKLANILKKKENKRNKKEI